MVRTDVTDSRAVTATALNSAVAGGCAGAGRVRDRRRLGGSRRRRRWEVTAEVSGSKRRLAAAKAVSVSLTAVNAARMSVHSRERNGKEREGGKEGDDEALHGVEGVKKFKRASVKGKNP